MSDEYWKEVQSSYRQHIESLVPILPKSIAELVKRVSLHDGLICRVAPDQKVGQLILELRCGDLQIGYSDVDIIYSGVDFAALDLVVLAAIARDRQTEVLCDEFDVDADKNFIHRILFHPAGEVSITFTSLDWSQTSRSDRSVTHTDDPFQGIIEEKAILLNPGFSVADAEYPDIFLKDNTLVVEFVDWREHTIRVTFLNAAGLKWQEIMPKEGPEVRDDECYEILNSKWLEAYFGQMVRSVDDHLHHFKLYFNTYGPLEVLASSFTYTEIT